MKWKILIAGAVGLVLVCFAFIFIPGVKDPSLFSLPYILWTGIIATVLLVVLTYFGSRFFPGKDK